MWIPIYGNESSSVPPSRGRGGWKQGWTLNQKTIWRCVCKLTPKCYCLFQKLRSKPWDHACIEHYFKNKLTVLGDSEISWIPASLFLNTSFLLYFYLRTGTDRRYYFSQLWQVYEFWLENSVVLEMAGLDAFLRIPLLSTWKYLFISAEISIQSPSPHTYLCADCQWMVGCSFFFPPVLFLQSRTRFLFTCCP